MTFGLWAFPAWSDPVQAVNIPPREYFAVLQRELARAEKSVTVCMYLFTLRPHQTQSPVFKLAQSLAAAHDRGVRVEVILDQNINFIEGGDRASDLSEGKNAPAYAFLKARGIPVHFDDASTYTHAKAVVIDEETVVAGSTNWTDSALTRNHEINVLIRSKDLAGEVLSGLRAIPRRDPLPNHGGSFVLVPGQFLQDENLLGSMISRDDARAFDIYLHLLRSSTTTVDHDRLAEALGLTGRGRDAYRREINRVLARLERRYGLLRVETRFNQDSVVAMTELPGGRFVRMPEEYWSLGWSRRLSFAEKAFLLISGFESEASTRRPRWSAAQKTLARRYGASPWFIGRGSTGLRRLNLLEVEYAPYAPPLPRPPAVYTPNPLYDPEELDRELERLKASHGAERFRRAREAVSAVFEDNDLNGIKELIELEDRYGADRVAAGVRIVGGKTPDNPLRNLGYLIGTVRRLGEQAQ